MDVAETKAKHFEYVIFKVLYREITTDFRYICIFMSVFKNGLTVLSHSSDIECKLFP